MQDVFYLFGGIIAAAVLYVVARAVLQDRRARGWPQVEGVVVSDRPTSYGPSSSLWEVEVRFRAADGRTVQAWSENPVSSTVPHGKGAAMTVRHDPGEPRRFRVDAPGSVTSSPRWVSMLFLAAVGVGVLVVVLAFL